MKNFAQLLELLALTPSRNRKIEALTQYFRDDARPRSRLCAGHPHRRADVQECEAGDAARRRDARGRSDAVRA